MLDSNRLIRDFVNFFLLNITFAWIMKKVVFCVLDKVSRFYVYIWTVPWSVLSVFVYFNFKYNYVLNRFRFLNVYLNSSGLVCLNRLPPLGLCGCLSNVTLNSTSQIFINSLLVKCWNLHIPSVRDLVKPLLQLIIQVFTTFETTIKQRTIKAKLLHLMTKSMIKVTLLINFKVIFPCVRSIKCYSSFHDVFFMYNSM